MRTLLEVKQLAVRRGRANLLRSVSWKINAGEHWVVLGSNGSGKTSLLKALTGYLVPTSGEITLLGQRYGASDWRELRLKIGMVTSAFATAIPPAETALETVASGKYAQLDLWAPVTSATLAAGRRLLREVALPTFADHPWETLSQGERQRVLIARALMARPKLLILDEPAAGLDPVARRNFLELVQTLVTRRKSTLGIIFVTHHVEEIIPAFTHALLLRGGEVVAAGPREKILTSAHLAETFGVPLVLHRGSFGYRLSLPPPQS